MSIQQRQQLLKEAKEVGLVENNDFKSTIQNEQLKKIIENKKEELAKNLQDVQDTVTSNVNDDENKKDDKSHDDEIIILRISPCGAYKTKIKGIKECARRSEVTEDELKKSLETNEKTENGYFFKEVE